MVRMAQPQPITEVPVRPRKTKKSKTLRDMFLSLAVILVPVLLLTWLFTNNLPDYPVQAVDPAPMLTQARAQSPYPIYVPKNLPYGDGGWTVTQASWVAKGQATRTGEGASFTDEWLWGALDPSRIYYAVNESDGDPNKLIQRVSRDGQRDGVSVVNGQEWQRWVSPDGRTRVLARQDKTYTITVTADATYAGVEALTSTLSRD